MWKEIKVFQADSPSEIPETIERVNGFLWHRSGVSQIHITEAGSSTGYSYTVAVEVEVTDHD
jgi:hypothetical protein